MVYKWRRQALAAAQAGAGFVPVLLGATVDEGVSLATLPRTVRASTPAPEPEISAACITVSFAGGTQVSITERAPSALVAATLAALR